MSKLIPLTLAPVASACLCAFAIGAPPEEEPAYDVVVDPMAEVCLRGVGDAAWATARLSPEALKPKLDGARATILLCATSGRFGRSFDEVIYSVEVEDPTGGGGEAAFLLQAFNSVRSYAWIERKRNRSPYEYGEISVESGVGRGAFSLHTKAGFQLTAALGPRDVGGLHQDVSFDGAIYLPQALNPREDVGEYFLARLDGEAEVFAFDSTVDTFSFQGEGPLATLLTEGHFTPELWILRPTSRHAKTDNLER